MKKTVILLISLILLFGFASCGIRENESTQPESESGTEPVSAVAGEESCMDAYKSVLRDYISNNNPSDNAVFSLIYLDGDSVPELVITPGRAHADSALLYSFDGEKAVELGEFGRYGSFIYRPREGIIGSGYTGMGVTAIDFYRLDNNSVTKTASFTRQLKELKEDSPYEYLADEKEVSYDEYIAALTESLSGVFSGVPDNNTAGEGIPDELKEEGIFILAESGGSPLVFPLTKEGISELGKTVFSANNMIVKAGDIIEFGMYPQTDVTDELGSELNELDGEWISYCYFSGTGNQNDGLMKASDYMRYKDVTYNGASYRAVLFDSYRPDVTGDVSKESAQYYNGYATGKVYWFRFEPIKWRVLDPSAGLVMADCILDNQPFNNYVVMSGRDARGFVVARGDPEKTFYANNYAKSSIRAWLNSDFYDTAFTDSQKADILSTDINNDGYYKNTDPGDYEEFDAPVTKDKIYLLACNDILNEDYGFDENYGSTDTFRILGGSDYAKCQGLFVNRGSDNTDGKSYWLLRSPSVGAQYVNYVYFSGRCLGNGFAGYTFGICPAMNLKSF